MSPCLPNYFTTCSPCLQQSLHNMFTMYVYHNYFTIYSSCMLTIIMLPYIHHDLFTLNVYFTICSPYMFTIINPVITSPHIHHDLFTVYVYHTHFTIYSSCMFPMVTSPYFTMDNIPYSMFTIVTSPVTQICLLTHQ